MNRNNLKLYLLVDNSLLHAASADYTETDAKSRPAWLMPIYADHALAVSPILIDMEAAYEAGDLDQVMGYLNAHRPALHVSFIETEVSPDRVAKHLQRFIFILDPEGKQFTLRFADCAVLSPLSSVLSEAQWATMKGPIARWGIHDRLGRILQLRLVTAEADGITPLCLNRDQIATLDEVSEPDHCIAKVKMMHHGAELPGSAEEQYVWAHAARETWLASGNSNSLFLLFLTEAALVSRGQLLRRNETRGLLLIDDASSFRRKLQELNDE